MSVKAIFFDNDSTLIDDLPLIDRGRAEPRHIRLCSGVGEALRNLSELDYRLFIVTNHDGIARGAFPAAAVLQVQARIADLLLREEVHIDGFYYCPHHPAGTVTRFARICSCRKPQPGLLLEAAREHDIDLPASWMIGSRLHDIEAGSRAGCRTVMVDTGVELEWRLGPHRIPTQVVYDLGAAAATIATHDQETV